MLSYIQLQNKNNTVFFANFAQTSIFFNVFGFYEIRKNVLLLNIFEVIFLKNFYGNFQTG